MRRVALGAGVAALAIIAFLAFRHESDTVATAGLDQALANLPPGYTATHGKIEADAVAGGLVIRDFTLAHNGTPLWSASRVKVSGADQQALRDVFDPSAYPAGHPAWTERRKLLSHFEADDLVIQSGDPKLSPAHLKRLSLDQLSGRPFTMPPTPENRFNPKFQADVALALAAERAAAENASISESAAPGDHAEAGSVTLTDYDSGKLGRAEIKDLTLRATMTTKTSKPVGFTLASLAVGMVDARESLTLVRQGSSDQQAKMAGLRIGSFDLGPVQVVVTGGPLVSVQSMHAANTYVPDGISAGSFAARAITIARHESPRDADTEAMIQVLGADKMVFDIDVAGSFDPNAKRARIARYDFDLHDLGTLRFSGVFSNLPTGGQMGPDAPILAKTAALAQSTIDRAQLAWEDRGLVTRAIAYAAQKSASTPEAVRAGLALPLVSLAMMMPDQPDAADQIGAFLRAPKTLTITLAPPQPVSLAEVARAPLPQRAHLLGASVKGD